MLRCNFIYKSYSGMSEIKDASLKRLQEDEYKKEELLLVRPNDFGRIMEEEEEEEEDVDEIQIGRY